MSNTARKELLLFPWHQLCPLVFRFTHRTAVEKTSFLLFILNLVRVGWCALVHRTKLSRIPGKLHPGPLICDFLHACKPSSCPEAMRDSQQMRTCGFRIAPCLLKPSSSGSPCGTATVEHRQRGLASENASSHRRLLRFIMRCCIW